MHVWNLSRLIDNITHFNKISSKQRGIQDDYSMISEQINNDGYVEVQLLPIGTNIEDMDKYAVASGCSDGTVHANIMPYKEDEDEVDVSISDFIVFRNQLQATKNGGIGGNTSGTTGTLNRRRSARQQQMSHKLRLLKSGPYPNSNAHELHKEDYTKLDKMLESPEEVQFNDKSNRRSKFIAKRQWSNKRAMKALSY